MVAALVGVVFEHDRGQVFDISRIVLWIDLELATLGVHEVDPNSFSHRLKAYH